MKFSLAVVRTAELPFPLQLVKFISCPYYFIYDIPLGAVDLCYSKKLYLLVIYTFRGHIRAYKKANEMLFEIIYILCGCGFSVIQVKVSKFTEKDAFKRTESQEEIQTA